MIGETGVGPTDTGESNWFLMSTIISYIGNDQTTLYNRKSFQINTVSIDRKGIVKVLDCISESSSRALAILGSLSKCSHNFPYEVRYDTT